MARPAIAFACLMGAIAADASSITQCSDLDGQCGSCLQAVDPRPDWASPCTFLDGPSEAGHTCQPSKWWDQWGHSYPAVRACADCAECKPAPSPFPATGRPPTSHWRAPPGPASGGKMPYSAPLAGNGDLGVALLGNASRAEYHVALNQFWAIRNYTYPVPSEPAYPRVEGLGQLSVTSAAVGGSGASQWHEREHDTRSNDYEAQLDTGRAEIRTATRRSDDPACATQHLRSTAFVSPHSNDLLIELALDPDPNTTANSDGKYAMGETTRASSVCAGIPITVSVSTIASNPDAPAAAGCASVGRRSSCSGSTAVPDAVWASRLAVTQSPKPIAAALALRVTGASDGALSRVAYNAAAPGEGTSTNANVSFILAAGHNVSLVLCIRTNLDAATVKGAVSIADNTATAGLNSAPDSVPAALAALPSTSTQAVADYRMRVRAEHDEWWSAFWNRSAISLPTDGLTENFWYGSQYLLGSAARTGKVAPGLWGPWVTGDGAAWHGDYTLNYNFEAPFYGAGSSNQLDAAGAQLVPLVQQMPRGRSNARSYNCSGEALHFTGHIAPWGYAASLGPSPYGDMKQHSDATFGAINMLSLWEYTHNDTWLVQSAFPFLSGVAQWWECWLERDEQSEAAQRSTDGYRWLDRSDCNNENCGSGNPSDLNPVISTTFVRRLFTTLVRMVHMVPALNARADVDDARVRRWSDFAEHMAVPQRAAWNVSGVTHVDGSSTGAVWTFSEALAGAPGVLPGPGQNAINLYPIFPSEIVSLSSPNATQVDCQGEVFPFLGCPNASLTLDTAIASVLQSGAYAQGNSFMEIFPAGVRVGVPGIIDHWREQLAARMGLNFVVKEDGGGLEVLGATEAVNNMLLTSHEGFLRFFPVWPPSDPASFRSLRAKGGFLVDAVWDNVTRTVPRGSVRIVSTVGSMCTVRSPWPAGSSPVRIVDDTTGTNITLMWAPDMKSFKFKTVAQHTYVLH